MKDRVFLVLSMLLILGLAGCGGTEPAGRKYGVSTGVDDIMKAAESEYTAGVAETGIETRETAGKEEEGQVSGSEEGQGQLSGSEESEGQLSGSEKEEGQPVSGEETDSESPAAREGSEKIDVDLTQLSSTMVYSEVFAMMMDPEKYDGKRIKMTGLYNYYHDAMVDKDYSACVVQDATACCAQGIDFVLTDDYDYPEDYPEIDEEITVTGVFNIYQEGKYTFFRLKDAVLD